MDAGNWLDVRLVVLLGWANAARTWLDGCVLLKNVNQGTQAVLCAFLITSFTHDSNLHHSIHVTVGQKPAEVG